LLGAVPLMKQSYFAAPLLGLVWLLVSLPAMAMRERIRIAITALATGAIPGFLYVAVVAWAGGFRAMLDQILGARPVWGDALLQAIGTRYGRVLDLGVLLVAVTAVDMAARRKILQTGLAIGCSWALRAVATYVILRLALGRQLTWAGDANDWGTMLVWVLAVLVLWQGITERRASGAALALLVLGWMTTLSWGYPNANLVGGSLALAALTLLWEGAPRPVGALAPPLHAAALAVTVLAFGWTVSVFSIARAHPYYDGPPEGMTTSLGPIVPAFGALRTNPRTAASVAELVDCIRRHPARRVTVLPDNAWVYPALEVENALPLDWFYPPEFGAGRQRLIDAAARLNREGDYLVLFQSVLGFDLVRLDRIPEARRRREFASYAGGVERAISRRLHDENITCGSLKGVWAPRAADGVPPNE